MAPLPVIADKGGLPIGPLTECGKCGLSAAPETAELVKIMSRRTFSTLGEGALLHIKRVGQLQGFCNGECPRPGANRAASNVAFASAQ